MTQGTPPTPTPPTPPPRPVAAPRWYDGTGARVTAVIAIALVAGFLVWYLAIRDTGSSSSSFNGGKPTQISDSTGGVGDLASSAGHPVYWAGSQPNTKLEATLTTNGDAYVRYLTQNAQIGSQLPQFLTVGTYPVPKAYKALQKVSKQSGAIVKHGPNGSLVVTNTSNPRSVYIAYPKKNIQIEVFDPDANRALKLATSGAITPVG
jgi:hypothetical protein